jgi:hypothetical protein
MAFNEIAAREMIAALATECERLQILVTSYNIAIKAYFSSYPKAYMELRRKTEQATRDPNLREFAGQKFVACYTLATDGLDIAAAQQLLDKARLLAEHMREGKEELFGESDAND